MLDEILLFATVGQDYEALRCAGKMDTGLSNEIGVRLRDLSTRTPSTHVVDPADLFGSVRDGGRHAQASPPFLS